MKLKRLAAEQRQCLKSLSDIFIIFLLFFHVEIVLSSKMHLEKTFVYLSKLIDVTSTISYANPLSQTLIRA